MDLRTIEIAPYHVYLAFKGVIVSVSSGADQWPLLVSYYVDFLIKLIAFDQMLTEADCNK